MFRTIFKRPTFNFCYYLISIVVFIITFAAYTAQIKETKRNKAQAQKFQEEITSLKKELSEARKERKQAMCIINEGNFESSAYQSQILHQMRQQLAEQKNVKDILEIEIEHLNQQNNNLQEESRRFKKDIYQLQSENNLLLAVCDEIKHTLSVKMTNMILDNRRRNELFFSELKAAIDRSISSVVKIQAAIEANMVNTKDSMVENNDDVFLAVAAMRLSQIASRLSPLAPPVNLTVEQQEN